MMLTGLVEPKLSVGGSVALAGLEVMAAVRATLPVKPPLGAMVIVEVALWPDDAQRQRRFLCSTSVRIADKIGIGAAVARRPLPHHRAYGSVHGDSRRLR